ncbi:hypothetical protein ANAEL_00610 [Anaerolineales bacterium]|nr:hypothetical protein ANAEL_00610 [Anaerolineales bacterium]
MSGRNAFSNNNATVAHDLLVAQKRRQTRNWEKSNPARRYLIPVDVRDEVAALAEALMENVDPVACVLFDYAETCHTRGTLKFKPRLNPKGRKHTLAWEETDTEPIQLPSRRHRSVKRTDTPFRSLKGQTAAYRLGAERHVRLRVIAEAYNLPLADILSAFFRHSIQAFRDGKLKIRREPVVMQMQVRGWSE